MGSLRVSGVSLSVLLVCLVPVLGGCAATKVAIAKRDLDVQTKMSATVFLDPVKPDLRSVFVQIRNTSDRQDLDLGPEIGNALAAKGYRVVQDPDTAHYVLQANVLQVGKASPTASEQALSSGYGTALMVAGSAYAMGNRSDRGLVGAGILGALAESIAGAAVKDVYFSITTDVQIKERIVGGAQADVESRHSLAQGTSGSTQVTFAEKSDWKTYQTRIVSTANKVNLEFEEAAPVLRAGLTRSLTGLF